MATPRTPALSSPYTSAHFPPLSLSPVPPFSSPGVARRRRHHRTTTLTAPQRSQTEKPSLNHYAHGPSAWTSGDGVTKQLHSGPVNVDRWRQHRRNTTLRAPQHSQMELTPPNHYAGYRPESRKRLGGIPENPGIPEPPDRPAQRTRAPEPAGSSGTQRNPAEPNGTYLRPHAATA